MDTSHTIITEIARLEGCDPIDLPPLYEAVDPDGLDSAIESVSDSDLSIEFLYNGYYVTVMGDGSIEINDDRPVQRA